VNREMLHYCAALLIGSLGAALLAPTPTSAEPVVRVLLDQAKSAKIRLVDPETGKPREFRLAARGAGIELDGRPKGATLLFRSASYIEYGGDKYRGELVVKRVGPQLSIVNTLPIEQYVAGTLFREVYPGWKGEALLAQAVVVRTYALSEIEKGRGADYDLRADTGSQVYGGVGAEGERAVEIVKDSCRLSCYRRGADRFRRRGLGQGSPLSGERSRRRRVGIPGCLLAARGIRV